MAAALANQEQLLQQLAAVQAKHVQQLTQLEAAQDHFRQECDKLRVLEAELAMLTQDLLAATANRMATAATSVQLETPPTSPLLHPVPGTREEIKTYIDLVNRTNAANPVTLILNPAAKSFGENIGHPRIVVEALQRVGIHPCVQLTTLEVGAHALARQAIERGARLVIGLGGDGTIEEVATGLMGSDCILGILPLGTMNNVARSLGIPLELQAACRLLAMGTIRHIDIGCVVTPDRAVDGYFLEAAGVGLSALAVPMGEDAEKGRWSGVFNRLSDFFSANLANVTVIGDGGEELTALTHVVTVANTPLFGNNMLLAPDAKIDDGLLDVAVYEAMELVDLGRYFFNISGGGRTHEPRVQLRQVRQVQIKSDIPLAANADLDVLSKQQAWTIEIAPRALAVIVGNGPALSIPVTAAPMPPPLAGPQPA